MNSLQLKIAAKMKQPALASFATITEDNKPWTRYVMVRADDNLTIRFATFTKSRKVAQIEKNSEVHITLGVTEVEKAESYIQIQGRAKIIGDAATKKAVWYDHLQNIFSGYDDPNYVVCEVVPYRIEFNTMNPSEPPEIWEG